VRRVIIRAARLIPRPRHVRSVRCDSPTRGFAPYVGAIERPGRRRARPSRRAPHDLTDRTYQQVDVRACQRLSTRLWGAPRGMTRPNRHRRRGGEGDPLCAPLREVLGGSPGKLIHSFGYHGVGLTSPRNGRASSPAWGGVAIPTPVKGSGHIRRAGERHASTSRWPPASRRRMPRHHLGLYRISAPSTRRDFQEPRAEGASSSPEPARVPYRHDPSAIIDANVITGP